MRFWPQPVIGADDHVPGFTRLEQREGAIKILETEASFLLCWSLGRACKKGDKAFSGRRMRPALLLARRPPPPPAEQVNVRANLGERVA